MFVYKAPFHYKLNEGSNSSYRIPIGFAVNHDNDDNNDNDIHLCVIESHAHSLGHAVAQLVEALRHKPEGRGFDSRWCHWNFSLT